MRHTVNHTPASYIVAYVDDADFHDWAMSLDTYTDELLGEMGCIDWVVTYWSMACEPAKITRHDTSSSN